MGYNEQLFRKRVDALTTDSVLFEAAKVVFVKRDDGLLWVTGDNVWYDEVIPNVRAYVDILQSVIDAAAELDEEGIDSDLASEVNRIRDEIADYQE